MKDETKTRKRRRRTCYDKMRAYWLEQRRQRRADPAASAVAQLLALFTFLFGRVTTAPVVPVPNSYVPPPMSDGHTRRIELGRRLGIPSRYVDIVLTQGTVPYSVVFEHLRRGGRSRQDAMTMLRHRAPDSCRDWLDHIHDWGLWSELLLCHVRNGDDEDTDVKMLKSTLAWLYVGDPAKSVPGPADAGTALNPETGGDESDSINDPNKPKP